MATSFEELQAKRVTDLRKIAEGIDHEAVHGYRTMHKAQLVQALCTALGIETHEHHEVVGLDKRQVKAQIRELKTQRDVALESHDRAQLKRVRRRIRRLKRKIRVAIV
jgi:hypothetical protein